MAMNEAFIPNMTGKEISFDVQPYQRGKGIMSKITGRKITVSEFNSNQGRTLVTYEVFDVEVSVSEGRLNGALSCGVPVPGTIHDLAGKTVTLIGVDFGQIYRATSEGKTIVIARCG